VNSKMNKENMDEKSTNLCMDDVELVLRRFASSKKDAALTTLLDSMFTETAEQKVAHEKAPGDSMEDKKEGE
jgi:hypothetical protein